MDEVALKTIAKEFLQQKRYVVILDDIWTINAWEAIKYALPNSNCGSRIMVTTHSSDIASYCKEPYGHIYNLESLAHEDSWTLFCKKIFRENSCSPELQELSRNILKRCGGLPLAIVTISGDYLIECSRLIKLWTVEGFVREKERMTIEEVAENYLYELINRSLLELVETSSEGAKWCRVHDFIREIILSKLRDQNFGAIVDEHSTKLFEKVRRLSIHNNVGNVPQNKSFSHLRSLFMFRVDTIPKSYVQAFFSSTRLLRVLDLRGAPLKKLSNEIMNLFHLRYLSLRRKKIKKLPKNTGKLQNLETLDLNGTNVRELPSEIFKLQCLRCLLIYNKERRLDSSIKSLVGFYGQVEPIKKLCSSLEKMNNLHWLVVMSRVGEVLDLQSLSSPPLLLQGLALRGHLEKFPNWISLLHNLKNIYLGGSKLSDDALEFLQKLANLVELTLDQAYDGEELCFKAGGFQALELLYLCKFEGLKLVTVEEGAMPHLEKLRINECKMLEKVPLGIECLINLKVIDFAEMSDEFVMALNCNKQDEAFSTSAADAYGYEINISCGLSKPSKSFAEKYPALWCTDALYCHCSKFQAPAAFSSQSSSSMPVSLKFLSSQMEHILAYHATFADKHST
ncbi:hypothetical protein HHK36_020272 [Tetracentron sinense]|uniref:NB-ARC domain-containing protein n=1 Tax=Tetracentron sinense TaxID=13715 RepID=A0A835D7V9_TETSI|nr:hypothetical protein HHK36_020272 [Tetracentron sinense]